MLKLSLPRVLTTCIVTTTLTLLQGATYAADIVFGHISSLTNPASSENATELRAGIQLAFDAANRSGGVLGNKLKLEMRDDALDGAKMVAMTSELISDARVIGLIGFLNTAGLTELTKADVFGKNDIALIAPFQGNANIVQAANVFPFRSGYTDEIAALFKEAKSTYKERIAVVHWNIAFGPPVAKFAQEHAAATKAPVIATVEIDAKPNGDLPGSIERALVALRQAKPDAVIVIGAGRPIESFFAAFRTSDIGTTQLYAMSVVSPASLVKNASEKAARGIVLAQATPYPYVGTTKLVGEYRRVLRELAPNKPPSFAHLEGYVAGKLAVAGLLRAGAKPTRQSLAKAMSTLSNYDLGGYTVSYASTPKRGWGDTELVIIGREGKLIR